MATARTNLENGAEAVRPTRNRRPIETTVAALNQPGIWIGPITRRASKGVQIRIAATGADPKHSPVIVRPPEVGGPVEISVVALNQPGDWSLAIREVTAKGVQTHIVAARTDPKHSPDAVRPPGVGRP